MNMKFKDALWWFLGILGMIILAIRIMEILWAKLRQVSAMSVPRDKQSYWKFSQWSWMPSAKKHLIYAPLWNKRHNREFRFSSAVNVGTLPSRLHLVILAVYLLSNIAYMFVLDYHPTNKWAIYAELRGRSGVLALVNMIPLIIFAGRNNPLISLLKISFDTYNLLHRWMGRIVVIETVVHVVMWYIPAAADGGFKNVVKAGSNKFILSGAIGCGVLLLMFVLSVSPLRHAFYETFLNLHILFALITFVCTWMHCAWGSGGAGLPQLPWIMAVCSLWFFDRLFRFCRLAYVNWSDKGFSQAELLAVACEATQVVVRVPRYVAVKPGSHAYLRFRGVRSWESHPFSIANVDYVSAAPTLPMSEKEPLSSIDKSNTYTMMSFVIGAHTGLTRKIYDVARREAEAAEARLGIRLAARDANIKQATSQNRQYVGPSESELREQAREESKVRISAAVEGPYAGHHNLDSYGHLVLFAGSTGITHQISYIRHLLEGYDAGTVATRRITLVWTMRELESLEWIRPFMDYILRIPSRRDVLRIQVFVTRPKNPRDVVSNSASLLMYPGRPNIRLLLDKEVREQVGAMAVTVCGPGGYADDVRSAVRAMQGTNVIDFIEESFTW